MVDAYRYRGSATNQTTVLTIPMRVQRSVKVSNATNIIYTIFYQMIEKQDISQKSSYMIFRCFSKNILCRIHKKLSMFIATLEQCYRFIEIINSYDIRICRCISHDRDFQLSQGQKILRLLFQILYNKLHKCNSIPNIWNFRQTHMEDISTSRLLIIREWFTNFVIYRIITSHNVRNYRLRDEYFIHDVPNQKWNYISRKWDCIYEV